MKEIKNIVFVLVILIFMVGMANAVTITGLSDVSTTDKTPTINFTVTGNNSSYECNLLIDGVASGSVTATNATETSITCNRTLEVGSYTYNVSVYNSTEIPATTYSSDYTLEITTMFSGVINVIDGIVPVFSSLKDLIVASMPLIMIIIFATILARLMKSYIDIGIERFGKQ